MSVIACKKYEDKIVIGADSMMVSGWTKDIKNFSKITKINGMIIGAVGVCQESSLFQVFAMTHKPKSATNDSVLDFIVEFADWQKNRTGNYGINNSYIIAFSGHVFTIEDFFVYEIKEFDAIGAGADFAKTALFLNHSVEESVKAACSLSCMVSEPVIIYTMELEK